MKRFEDADFISQNFKSKVADFSETLANNAHAIIFLCHEFIVLLVTIQLCRITNFLFSLNFYQIFLLTDYVRFALSSGYCFCFAIERERERESYSFHLKKCCNGWEDQDGKWHL